MNERKKFFFAVGSIEGRSNTDHYLSRDGVKQPQSSRVESDRVWSEDRADAEAACLAYVTASHGDGKRVARVGWCVPFSA